MSHAWCCLFHGVATCTSGSTHPNLGIAATCTCRNLDVQAAVYANSWVSLNHHPYQPKFNVSHDVLQTDVAGSDASAHRLVLPWVRKYVSHVGCRLTVGAHMREPCWLPSYLVTNCLPSRYSAWDPRWRPVWQATHLFYTMQHNHTVEFFALHRGIAGDLPWLQGRFTPR